MDCYKDKKCNKCVFPIAKQKKYRSYSELLFDRKIGTVIDRSNTLLPYRDTQERLDTLKAKVAYSKKIDKSGRAKCNSPWYYPSYPIKYPNPKPKYFY